MELRKILRKVNSDDDALIELIKYYDSFIKLYAKKRHPLIWEDCYSYIKIEFIQDLNSGKFDKYLSKTNSELDQLIKRIFQNKSFDYWRSKSKTFNESYTLNLDISESNYNPITNIVNKIYLKELLDKQLTKTEHEVINEIILKDKKVSLVSIELGKSVSTINKTKNRALKKLLKILNETEKDFKN